MLYQFDFRPYQRQFNRPLQTNHGTWNIREGIILRLQDNTGAVTWGEIAPISWFGSETLAEALKFCRQLPTTITAEIIYSIPSHLPACQFGFESALLGLSGSSLPIQLKYSALLPAKESALQTWQNLWKQGYSTFKWKIGVAPIQQEIAIFKQLIQALPKLAKLRLDANGGLTWETAKQWLEICENVDIIEYIEQPLPINQFANVLALNKQYSTPIALDESVATLPQIHACYHQGWRGIFVIKPAIAGFPSQLRQFCQNYTIESVFSSVFETAIARNAALNLAAEIQSENKAVGFGINHWFKEDNETWLEKIWNPL